MSTIFKLGSIVVKILFSSEFQFVVQLCRQANREDTLKTGKQKRNWVFKRIKEELREDMAESEGNFLIELALKFIGMAG